MVDLFNFVYSFVNNNSSQLQDSSTKKNIFQNHFVKTGKLVREAHMITCFRQKIERMKAIKQIIVMDPVWFLN